MREIIEKIREWAKKFAPIGAGAALLCASAPAFGQTGSLVGRNVRFNQFTNAATLNVTNFSGGAFQFVAGSGSATVNSSNVTVYPGRGLGIFLNCAFTNSGTEANTLGFDVSYDGTNFSNSQPLSYPFAGNGSSQAFGYTNIPASSLDNVRAIRLSKITTAHASSLFVTNVVWSVLP